MPPTPRSPKANGNGMEGMWKWIAAIVGALLVGLTPFLLTQNAQRDYAQKDDLAAVAQQLVALSERVARNEEQVETITNSVEKLLEISQSGETRLSNIEAVLARIEATLAAAQAEPATTTP